ncbi:MAG: helix-turn-helix transcriptional regulator [Acidimicrobiia bacterium]|nr:helix-turn-helix transcriptional regulator [Acidimicrobiia bacterium]MYB73948.1 helix-turn-helix transcriptional regulator [Acidimicrobiia bacterium]MYH99884.1 helix-turn-helix transcriptional regulator [Acidimicrobiia bacterium]
MTTKSFDELAEPIDADPVRNARAEAYKQEVEAKIFAHQLAELRSELGINQVDLARKLGITQGGVSRLERSVDPKLSTLCKLTSALGGTLHIEISVGGRTVSLLHPSSSGSSSQADSDDPAPIPA